MGFLDSEFGKVLLGQTRYGQAMLAQEDADRRANQYMQVANQYLPHQLPPDQAGPVSNGQPLDQDFATRIAAIPGYQQMAMQLLQQQQQQRQFDTMQGGVSAYQQAQLDQADRQFGSLSAYQKSMLGMQQQAQDFQKYQWQNLSPYQREQLLLEQRGQDMRLQAEQMQYGNRNSGGALPGQPLYDEQMKDLQAYSNGLDAVAALKNLWGSTGPVPGVFSRDKLAKAAPWQTMLISTISRLANSGVLNEKEAERYTSMLGEPDMFSSNKRTMDRLEQLQVILQRQHQNVLDRNPNLPRPMAPEGFK